MTWPTWLPQPDAQTIRNTIEMLALIGLHEYQSHPNGRAAFKRILPSLLWFLKLFGVALDATRKALLQGASANSQGDAAIAQALENALGPVVTRLEALETAQKTAVHVGP